MAIKCPICQSSNPETATFCADCGTKLLSPKHIEVTETAEIPAEVEDASKRLAGGHGQAAIQEPS
jgi:ribosomal protein L40E